MNTAAATHDLNRARGVTRTPESPPRRPTPLARSQISVFAEYLHEAHTQPRTERAKPPLLLTAPSAA